MKAVDFVSVVSDLELDSLRRDVPVAEIRRVEEEPKDFAIPGSAAIEEDLKILDAILDRANIGN